MASWAILPEVTFQTNVFSSETALYCGDGHLNGTEQCDDRNITERDGCSSTCILETPEAKIISTPPYGEQPLTATFTATKDSRAKYISLNYGDGTPISTNPIFPISHIYPNL
ncbi:TPA: hypothetical protein DCZ39_00085 [Patescibacteria group bacterium]|nr:hypothetical protein [Candidatus Gracilibacteria bacterium]